MVMVSGRLSGLMAVAEGVDSRVVLRTEELEASGTPESDGGIPVGTGISWAVGGLRRLARRSLMVWVMC